MTRVEAILAQVMELTTEERDEIRDMLEQQKLREQMDEIDRRLDEIKVGAARGIDVEDTFRRAREELQKRQRSA